jgi:hypothetical protein
MNRHTGPAHLGVEPSRNDEHGVPNGLALQSADVHAVQEQVLGICLFRREIVGLAGHPVGARKHQLANERFDPNSEIKKASFCG